MQSKCWRGRKALEERNKRISVLSKQVKTLADLKEVADATDKTVLNAKQVVELINRKVSNVIVMPLVS